MPRENDVIDRNIRAAFAQGTLQRCSYNVCMVEYYTGTQCPGCERPPIPGRQCPECLGWTPGDLFCCQWCDTRLPHGGEPDDD